MNSRKQQYITEYSLSADELNRTDIDFRSKIYKRLCPNAQTHLGQSSNLTNLDQVMQIASEFCGNDPEFINPRRPLVEVTFMLLLIAPANRVPETQLLKALNSLFLNNGIQNVITEKRLRSIAGSPGARSEGIAMHEVIVD